MTDEIYQRIESVVKGSVQGVSFRAYTKRKATSLGLTGSVRNLPNGDVKVIAEGPRTQLILLIKWLKTTGSPASHVTTVNVQWFETLEHYSSFRIAFN